MARASSPRDLSPTLFLDLFYPFHYRVGFTIEQALRGNQLSQHQTIILWIIHSEGEQGTLIPRKKIEARMTSWFDITSSAISKALRSLARADMPCLEITEDPHSARERLVALTPAGQQLVEQMMARSERLIARIVEHLDDKEIRAGLHFLERVSEIVPRLENREELD
jgi:DNA-binding MarR family transcriptional regulator